MSSMQVQKKLTCDVQNRLNSTATYIKEVVCKTCKGGRNAQQKCWIKVRTNILRVCKIASDRLVLARCLELTATSDQVVGRPTTDYFQEQTT